MAAGLVVNGITQFRKYPDGVPAGENGEPAHADTSIVASQVDGGMGSLCLRRLSM